MLEWMSDVMLMAHAMQQGTDTDGIPPALWEELERRGLVLKGVEPLVWTVGSPGDLKEARRLSKLIM